MWAYIYSVNKRMVHISEKTIWLDDCVIFKELVSHISCFDDYLYKTTDIIIDTSHGVRN